jgi:hypothetical protein
MDRDDSPLHQVCPVCETPLTSVRDKLGRMQVVCSNYPLCPGNAIPAEQMTPSPMKVDPKTETIEKEYDRQAKFEADMANAVQQSIMSQLQAGLTTIQTQLMSQSQAQAEQTNSQLRAVLESQNQEIRRSHHETLALAQAGAGSDADRSRRRKSRREQPQAEPYGAPQQLGPTADQQLEALLQLQQQAAQPVLPLESGARSSAGLSMQSNITLDQIPATEPAYLLTSPTGPTSLASTLQDAAPPQLDVQGSLAQPPASTLSLATTTSFVNVVEQTHDLSSDLSD